MSGLISFTPLTLKHVDEITSIHLESLTGDFLPSLGKFFLNALYKSILELNLGFGVVAKSNNKVKGFVLATKDMRSLFKCVILKKPFSLCLSLIPAIIKKPILIKKVFETFTYNDKESKEITKAELIVIAVDHMYRNQKIGSKLCLILNREFVKRGIDKYKVTVNSDNFKALSFYKKNGFKFSYDFNLYNKKWDLLTKQLPK